MVPLSERRHRLYEREIPEVIYGLALLLKQMLKERKDAERAEIAFRCLQRLLEEGAGRPRYDNFSWDYLDHFLASNVKYSLQDLLNKLITDID
jgi:hypothetical protein